MNKRGLLAILVFCMILGIVPFFSLPVQAEKTMTWQDAYFELLDNPSMQHEVIDSLLTIKDPLFAIRDIDNNGIPELIIRWDPVDLPGIYEIFTYSNGVKKIGSIGMRTGTLFISDKLDLPGLLTYTYAYNGNETFEYTTIKNKELVSETIWSSARKDSTDGGYSGEIVVIKNNERLMAELNRGIELMEYPFTPINMYDKIYSYGRAQETNPHPYAIALRDYLKEVNDKDDNNGYPPTAYLADINRDGIMEMLVNGTRLFYLQDGKLKTYDIEADFGDADYTMEFSQNNYLVAQPTVGDAEATTVLILKDGKIVKEPEFVGMYFLGYTSFIHGDKEISELEYEKLKEFYGVTEVYSNRKNQIDEILAMTNTIKAMTTSSKVKVNGILKEFESYNINGNNYFKLRDLAQVVNKTSKNFEVEWDGAKNAIRLISNKAYTPVGGELAKGDGKTKSAQVTTSAIYKDGKEISLTAYNIGGSNFFKLRDIAKAFDIGVTWDGPTNTVGIDTGKRYVAE